MTSYVVIAGLLLAFAILAVQRRSPALALSSTLLVGGFIGLRYQLGYDWVAYEKFFDEVPTFFERGDVLPDYGLADGTVSLEVEPIFLWLIMTIKSLGGTAELLFAVVAIFNVWIIHFVSRNLAPGSVPFVWLVYFCLAGIAIQMNIVRQALASSFVLLGLLALARDRRFFAAVLMLVGAATQISTIIYWPLYLVGIRRPSKTMISIILCVGIGVVVFGVDLFAGTIQQLTSVAPVWLAEKLEYYANFEPVAISIGAAPIILWNVAVLLVLYRHDPLDRFVNIALWLTVYMLAAHVLFSSYPTVWNRILAVALPWQLAAIWRSEPFKDRLILFKGAAVASIGALGIAGLIYQLNQPKNEPFVPYHSLIQVWLGDEGYGRDRAERAIDDFYWDQYLRQ